MAPHAQAQCGCAARNCVGGRSRKSNSSGNVGSLTFRPKSASTSRSFRGEFGADGACPSSAAPFKSGLALLESLRKIEAADLHPTDNVSSVYLVLSGSERLRLFPGPERLGALNATKLSATPLATEPRRCAQYETIRCPSLLGPTAETLNGSQGALYTKRRSIGRACSTHSRPSAIASFARLNSMSPI
jgi:hypothetical protein